MSRPGGSRPKRPVNEAWGLIGRMMSKAAPKMIGDEINVDIRDAARRAARQKGLSVGEWLDGIMAEFARTRGVSPSDLSPNECLEAVTTRLAQCDERQSEPAVTPQQFMAGIQAARMRTSAASSAATGSDTRHGLSWLFPRSGDDEDTGASATAGAPAPTLEQPAISSSDPTHRGERRRTLAAVAPAPSGERSVANANTTSSTYLSGGSRNEPPMAAAVEPERRETETGQTPIEAKLSALFQALNRQQVGAAREGRLDEAPPAVFSDPVRDAPLRQQTLPRPTPKSSSFNLEQAIAAIGRRQAVLDGRAAGSRADRETTGAPATSAEPVSGDASRFRSIEANARPVTPLRRHDDQAQAPSPVRSFSAGASAPVEPMPGKPAPDNGPMRFDDPLATSVFATLQGDIARMSSSLEAILADVSKREPSPPPPPDPAVGELRSMLDKMRPDQTLGSLESRVAALTARIDRSIETQLQPDVIERLSQRIENVRSSLAEQLAAERPAQIDTGAMERAIRELAGSIAAMQNEATDIRSLDEMVHRLADKLDQVTEPRVDAEMVTGLQGQIVKLTDRIDRSDAGLNAIISVERSMGDLFSHLEQTRGAAIAAAENVARATARDTLVAALADKGLPSNQRTPDPAMEQVTHDIADLRQARDLADKRLHGILGTLNLTLEKVVERLGALEDEGHGVSMTMRGRVQTAASPGDVTIAGAANPLNPAHRSRTIPSVEVAVPIASPRLSARRPEANTVGDADFMLDPIVTAPKARDVGRSADLPATAPTVDAESEAEAASTLDSGADPASFIAAARKAAQAAMRDAASRPSISATSRARGGASSASADQPAVSSQVKRTVSGRRRPLLLALAGLVLLMGAVQVARITLAPGSDMAQLDERDLANSQAMAKGTRTAAAGDAKTVVAEAPGRPVEEADAVAAPAPAPASGSEQLSASASPAVVKTLPTLAMGAGPARPAQQSTVGAGLRDMANDGSASAQYEIGLRMAEGRGMPRDPKGAADWFEKAAKQGLAPAAYRLGSLYEKGTGVPKDAGLSVQWYEKAAEAGNIRAMHNLAVMSAEGANGKSDYAKAASWFTKAAETGVRDSQFNLAILYARGLGIEQNLAQSYIWFSVAAAQGDTDAATKRDEVAQRLDAKTLAAAKKTADAFQPAASVAAANEVTAPPGGWDEVAPRIAPVSSLKAGASARVSSSM